MDNPLTHAGLNHPPRTTEKQVKNWDEPQRTNRWCGDCLNISETHKDLGTQGPVKIRVFLIFQLSYFGWETQALLLSLPPSPYWDKSVLDSGWTGFNSEFSASGCLLLSHVTSSWLLLDYELFSRELSWEEISLFSFWVTCEVGRMIFTPNNAPFGIIQNKTKTNSC